MTPISIVMHAHNAAMHLERSLPLVLQQDYPAFEVLVVVDNCTDLTIERLEQMEVRWPCLRHIIIPSSSWHPDRHRLAMSLGAKSAQNDWIMVLQPEYAPSSTQWLGLMAAAIDNGTDSIVGYNSITTSDGAHERFVNTFEQWLSLPFRRTSAEECNILARRELLLQNTPHSPKRSAAVICKGATLHCPLPYGGMWWQKQLRNMRRHNAVQGLRFRTLHALAVWQSWLIYAAAIVTGRQSYWWAGLTIFLLWLIVATLLFTAFCRRVGEKPFYLSYLYHSTILPLEMWL